MKLVFLGLSITSSWGNGHATTYRALLAQLAARGHEILFLERDQPWYAESRDLLHPGYCRAVLYHSREELQSTYRHEIAEADCVVLGSYVPEGVAIARWLLDTASGVTAFYDIDTPVTLDALTNGACEYISADLIPEFDVYFSFTGGPVLGHLESEFGAQSAHALYCSVDPEAYRPLPQKAMSYDLGYLGTYSADRQSAVEALLLAPARHLPAAVFVVAGSLYPSSLHWPDNVSTISHLSPDQHCSFYNAQRFTLNATRAAMTRMGYSPSVRLFEAAACGTPIISDQWPGLDTFFKPGLEILIPTSSAAVVDLLVGMPDSERLAIGQRARERVLREHTAAHRAAEFETIVRGVTVPLASALEETHL